MNDSQPDVNAADCLLLNIKNYPFLHSGPQLVSGVIKAFNSGCPNLGDFLDARLVVSPHLDARLLKRAAIRKTYEEDTYGTMVADIWQDKVVLKNELFM